MNKHDNNTKQKLPRIWAKTFGDKLTYNPIVVNVNPEKVLLSIFKTNANSHLRVSQVPGRANGAPPKAPGFLLDPN